MTIQENNRKQLMESPVRYTAEEVFNSARKAK